MVKSRRWNVQEDTTLFQAIKANPQSKKKEVFALVALKLKRTPEACAVRWYTKVSNPRAPEYIHDSFKATFADVEKSNVLKVSRFTRIKSFIKHVFRRDA